MEENIYNLIPKEYVPPIKEPLYRSKYSGTIPPTGSTIGLKNSSIPGISNLSGDLMLLNAYHPIKASSGTFGKPKGALKPNSHDFIRKGSGLINSMKLPSLRALHENPELRQSLPADFKYDETFKKPPVPTVDEKPIIGLVSNKNYLLSNAVDVILAQPKICPEEVDYLKKGDYGKVPKYLQTIKGNIENEFEHMRTMQRLEEEKKEQAKYLLSEEEVSSLREGLKKKWEAVNKDYQHMTHISKLDTVGLRRRKEEYERELAQIEKDLEKLNKQYIFIDTTA